MYKKLTTLFLFFSVLSICITNQVHAKNKEIKITNYTVNATTSDNTGHSILPNSKTNLFYYDENGKKIDLNETYSDDNGEIKNISITVPENIKRLYFNHNLIDKSQNSVIDENGKQKSLISSISIPNNNVINGKTNYLFGGKDKANQSFTYVQTWNAFQTLKTKEENNINFTVNELNKYKDKIYTPFSSNPIKIMYKNSEKPSGALTKNNEDKKGILEKDERYLLINNPPISNNYQFSKQLEDIKINLAHEWAHWNMFQVIGREGMPSTNYQSHNSFNSDERISYKEGWGVFQANRYTWGYNMNVKLDTMVQKDKIQDPQYGKKDQLFGKSTNSTVYHVIRDLYDLDNNIEGKEDKYNVAKDVFGDKRNYSNQDLEKLSDGLLYITMKESKATTLEEYLKYLDNNFVNDKQGFTQVLNTNGLNSSGQFTLDENNNKIN